MDTCEVIAKYLFKIYVCIPQDDKRQEIVDGFEGKWGFPQVIGAVDGTYIPIQTITTERGIIGSLCRHWWITDECLQALVDYR